MRSLFTVKDTPTCATWLNHFDSSRPSNGVRILNAHISEDFSISSLCDADTLSPTQSLNELTTLFSFPSLQTKITSLPNRTGTQVCVPHGRGSRVSHYGSRNTEIMAFTREDTFPSQNLHHETYNTGSTSSCFKSRLSVFMRYRWDTKAKNLVTRQHVPEYHEHHANSLKDPCPPRRQ